MFMEKKEDILSRIQSKIKIEYLGFKIKGIPSPCHIWQGGTSGSGRGGGYGRICLFGQTCAVHIVVFKLFRKIIKGKQIDHMCCNRLCCNLDHLQMVSNLKNQELKISRAKELYCDAV